MNLQELAIEHHWGIRKRKTGFQLRSPNGAIIGTSFTLTRKDCLWWIGREFETEDDWRAYRRMYMRANGRTRKKEARARTPAARFKMLDWKLVTAGTDWNCDDDPRQYRLIYGDFTTKPLNADDLDWYLRYPQELDKLRPVRLPAITCQAAS